MTPVGIAMVSGALATVISWIAAYFVTRPLIYGYRKIIESMRQEKCRHCRRRWW